MALQNLRFMILGLVILGLIAGRFIEPLSDLLRASFMFNAGILALFLISVLISVHSLWLLSFDESILDGLKEGRVRNPGRSRLHSTRCLMREILAKFLGSKPQFSPKFAMTFAQNVDLILNAREKLLTTMSQGVLYVGLIGGFYEIFMIPTPESDSPQNLVMMSSAVLGLCAYLLLRIYILLQAQAHTGFQVSLNSWLAEPGSVEVIEPKKSKRQEPKL